jgi:hypothetical protein
VSLISSVMETLFAGRVQWLDSQYDLAVDAETLTKAECIKHKLQKYLQWEVRLSEAPGHATWANTLAGVAVAYKGDLDVCHAVWKLKQEQVTQWFNILGRGMPKKRSLVFWGRSNTGKSLVANGLLAGVAPGFIQRDGGTNVHWLENIYKKMVILWEEPSITMTNLEDVKLLLGGERIVINRKNKNLIDRPPGPAVMITTNKEFWNYQRDTLSNRCQIVKFERYGEIPLVSYEQVGAYLHAVYRGKYN